MLPQNGEIPIPEEEKNYFVFIRTEDYLGHEKIYVSDGIMTDWEEPQLQIAFAGTQEAAKTGIYGEDVDLEFVVQDEKAAIAQIEILIKGDGEELVRETLFQESSLEEREKYKEILLPYTVVVKKTAVWRFRLSLMLLIMRATKQKKS